MNDIKKALILFLYLILLNMTGCRQIKQSKDPMEKTSYAIEFNTPSTLQRDTLKGASLDSVSVKSARVKYFDPLIIEGTVGIYNKGIYNLDEEEGWKRIEINGGIQNTRRGYLKFQYDGITFAVGSTNREKEIYMELKFQDINMARITVFAEIFHELYLMRDINGNQVPIKYFYDNNLFLDHKERFVISDYEKGSMYILVCDTDVFNVIKDLPYSGNI